MALPSYYHELYVAICNGDSRIQGSGLCFDGARIITCAHVVNSALGLDQTDSGDKTGRQVTLRFSQSPTRDPAQYHTAKVVRWFPPANDKQFLVKHDLAILELDDKDIPSLLSPHVMQLRFIADDAQNNTLTCVSHDVRDPNEERFIISGTILDYIPVEGKTQLSTSDNVRDAFFRRGSSGSPVYSELYKGISGIVDQQVDEATGARHAFMIDVRRIEELFDEIYVYQPSLEKKNREETKYLCNRQNVITGIATERAQFPERGNLFLLWASNKQEGHEFQNIYRQRVLHKSDSRIFITVDLPVDSPALFQSRFYEEMAAISAQEVKRKIQLNPGDDILTCYNRLSGIQHKIFLFRITECTDEEFACYQWFARDFLKVGQITYPDDLHIIVIHEYRDAEISEAQDYHNRLLKEFRLNTSFPLANVTPRDISRWISMFKESNSSAFKLKLMELLEQERDYPMTAIFRKYREALMAIPDNEKI